MRPPEPSCALRLALPSVTVMDEHEASRAWASVLGRATITAMAQVTNPIWRVTGQDGRTWVLKRLPEWSPGVGPVEEYRVLAFLQAAGLPVACPVVTDDGVIAHNATTLRAGAGEKQPTGTDAFQLAPLLPDEGRPVTTEEQAHTIGAGIGRLDAALAACPWPVTSFTDDPANDTIGAAYPHLSEDLRSLLDPIHERLREAIVDLPVQRAHGDCNAGNVLVHEGTVSGYIDLDHLPISPRVRDLAYYILSTLTSADHGAEATRLLPRLLPAYVAGYRAEHPLSDREIQAVVPLMLTLAAGGADWHRTGWRPDPEAYLRGVGVAARLVEHEHALTGTLVGG